ncbi:hypothetical protein [Marinactinospora rubrisoli]|uniref:Uncharacterized protein n=1 Tax=Marinactinospora rubrisoli TaxID=2715399 RepID=A0ABW2KPL0_9ACTN
MRDHRTPVARLEVRTGASWTEPPRAEYDHFISESGLGCGSDLRITGIYGRSLGAGRFAQR